MSSTNNTADVALRPWPAPNKGALNIEDILAQVSQLTAERGHLRDITEQTLQDEVEASRDSGDVVAGDSEEKEKIVEPSVKEKLEEIHAARIEMLKKLECVSCTPHQEAVANIT